MMKTEPAALKIVKGINGETIEVFDDFAIIDRRGVSRLRKRRMTVFFAAVKDLQFRRAGIVTPGYLRFSSDAVDPMPSVTVAGGDERAIMFTRQQEEEFRRIAFILLFRLRNGRLPRDEELGASARFPVSSSIGSRSPTAAKVIATAAGLAALALWASARTPDASGPESARTAVVTQDQYGSRWPWLKFDQGVVSCSNDEVTIQLGNVIYGLNGHARSRRRYPDPREMMGRVPNTESISADGKGIYELGATDELIQLGLSLCRRTNMDK